MTNSVRMYCPICGKRFTTEMVNGDYWCHDCRMPLHPEPTEMHDLEPERTAAFADLFVRQLPVRNKEKWGETS